MRNRHDGAGARPARGYVREEAAADGGRAAGDAVHDLPVDPDAVEPAPRPDRRRAPGVLRGRWDILLVIAAGGALGSVGRWAVSTAVPHDADGVPWATWVENVTGAFVLGALMVLILDAWPPNRYLRPFLGVGVLGGYTTFSTYMLDTRTLLAEGQVPIALGYLFGTLLTGLFAVWAGIGAARAGVGALEHRRRHRHQQPSGGPRESSAGPPNTHRDLDREDSSRSRE